MAVVVFALPILPGKQEAWRRYMQELLGRRRGEFEASRRTLSICRERGWLTQSGGADLVIGYVEAEDLDQLLAGLQTPDRPFERWYRRQLLDLHGLDLHKTLGEHRVELVLDWQRP